MNAKATTLFFILLALANCSNSPTKNTQESQLQNEPADEVLSPIGSLELALTDLSADQETALNNFSDLIGTFMGIHLDHAEVKPALRLAALLDYKNYDPKDFANVPEDFKLETQALAILEGLPTYEALLAQAGNDPKKAQAIALEQASSSLTSYLEHLQKSFRKQWYTQLQTVAEKIRSASEKTEVPTVDLVRYQEGTRKFGLEFRGKFKAMKALSSNEEFKQKLAGILEKFINDANEFYGSAVELTHEITNMLASPIDFLHLAAEQLFDNASPADMSAEDLETTRSRIGLLVGALAVLSEERQSFNHLNRVFRVVSARANIDTVLTKTGEKLANSAKSQDYAAQVFQSMIDSIIDLPVDTAMIYSEVSTFLNGKVHLYYNNNDVGSMLTTYFNTHPVVSAKGLGLSDRIRNLDRLLYLKPAELKKEDRDTLFEDVYAIHNSDTVRVNIIQRLKMLFTLPALISENFPAERSALYEATLFCADHLPNDRLSQDHHELFDECLDLAKKNGQSWAQKYYITFKLLNLFFTSKTSAYRTTFPVLSAADQDVQALFRLALDHESLGKRLKTKFQEVSGNEDAAALENTSFITAYSGKTYDAKIFNFVNRMENDKMIQHAKIDLQRANVKVNLHDNDSTALSGNKITVDSKPRTEDHPVQQIEDPFSGIIERIPEDNKPVAPRIQKGQQFNFVNEVVGRLPSDIREALRQLTFDEFVNFLPGVKVEEGVEYTNVIVKVTRKDSPCHPARQANSAFGGIHRC